MTTAFKHIMGRQRLIAQGAIGHDRGKIAEKQSAEPDRCHLPAIAQARADKSDPYIYKRIRSHLNNGITLIGDYAVEFGRGQQESPFAVLDGVAFPWGIYEHGKNVPVDIPMRRKIPCY